ncbi:hypothetical protein CHARACLAT_026928 [Characodon lateralis]|uniref:Uncharacterized protein n=1 Tax=Characodon lateralis TaxID=208331 RepID=A0ABU7EX26_9TELE|nr:hypothetical protein [Characodon lateralis]
MDSIFSLSLLLLFVGCLSSGAAQIDSSTMSPTQTVQAAPILPSAKSSDWVIIFLQTAIKSHHELNETMLAQVLKTLQGLIQGLHPHTEFSLTLKNTTKV